ncbi:MAG: folate-binding protein [Halofilum sp. (in: g-proteobacteria)]
MTTQASNRASPDPVSASTGALDDSLCCSLEGTGVLTVNGSDAASFLNSQFSSDIAGLHPGETALTSYSDARGRVLAVPRIFADAQAYHLVLPTERVPAIAKQLNKFVLRADVRVEDAGGDRGVLGLSGPRAGEVLHEKVEALPQAAWHSATLIAGGQVARLPGERPRWLVCAPHEALEGLRESVHAAGVGDGDHMAWRLREIEAGLPNVYEATAEHFVAQMLNLDRLDALDFRKGCYPGQEVIARTHYLGRIKRRMHVLRYAGTPADPGSTVYAAEQAAGEVVDAAAHPEGGSLALAVVRLEATESTLAVGAPGGPAAEVMPPPYDLSDDA